LCSLSKLATTALTCRPHPKTKALSATSDLHWPETCSASFPKAGGAEKSAANSGAIRSCPVSLKICQRLQDLVQMFIGFICGAVGAFAAARGFDEKANLE
jgi:hypothetical protein